MRVAYSFLSSFLKVLVFALTVIAAYRVTDAAEEVVTLWMAIPFACFAILGAKTAVEAADAFIRRLLGFTVA
jgi:uncharacterized membrane protein YeiH